MSGDLLMDSKSEISPSPTLYNHMDEGIPDTYQIKHM